MNVIRVAPAYGRRYFRREEVRADWEANKDFLMVGEHFSYINKSDFENYGNPLDCVIFQAYSFAVSFFHSKYCNTVEKV